jgi:hypothetical protein
MTTATPDRYLVTPLGVPLALPSSRSTVLKPSTGALRVRASRMRS